MENKNFQRELDNLEKLLDRLNKKNRMRGGEYGGVEAEMDANAVSQGDRMGEPSELVFANRGGANRGPARTFKLIEVEGKPTNLDHHATLYNRTVDGKTKSTPPPIVNAAKKIFRQLCKSQGKKGTACKINFTIVETTREVDNEGHLEMHNPRMYNGHIEKKKNPTVRKLPGGKQIKNLYDVKVDYIPMDKANKHRK
jgi:hypothetical protein